MPDNIGFPEEGKEDKYYDRTDFAEVVIGADGKVSLDYSDRLDAKSVKQLEAVYKNTEPFIRAALQEGSLIRLRFVLGDGFYAEGGGGVYSGINRQIIVTVPEYGKSALSLDDLEGTLVHETLHALARRGSVGQGISQQEFNRFVDACNTLALSTFNSAIYGGIITDKNKIDILKEYLPEDQKHVIDDFITYAMDGRAGDILFGDEKYFHGSTLPDACRNPSSIVGLIEDFARKNNFTDFSFDDGVKLDDEVQALDEAWTYAQRQGSSVYSLLNEAKYVVTDDEDKKYFGHSEENAAELMASFMHVGLRYRGEFESGVISLSWEQKEALRDLIRLSVDIVVTDNEELAGVMSDLEAEMLAALS